MTTKNSAGAARSAPSSGSSRPLLRTRQVPAHLCAAISLVAAVGALAAGTLLGTEWRWSLQLLACVLALVFAYQGFRLSGQPGAKGAVFARYGSIVGAGLAIAAAAGYVMLLLA